ncbi:MAG: tolB protein precursor [Spirosomataceae bacterium]
MPRRFVRLFSIFCLLPTVLIGQSQYFGQNKQRNKTNNFKVTQTPHFELYHYLENKNTVDEFLINSENWYKLHQNVFKMAFVKPNPVILYNSHPDFQETTAIGGEIGEGTGGVTEGFRTRVVMPLMYTNRQTDHVLGHELVHAFQYQTLTYGGDSTSLANIQNLPLFMVEGLAEYMSLGRNDSHTSMWMRDAVLNNDIPTIKDLVVKQHKYFPYRWGQAFWAYVTANYGDDIIRPLFKETAMFGIERAFISAFKMDTETFSQRFINDQKQYYNKQKENRETQIRGKLLASSKEGGEMNIAPVISPDGKYFAYISSRNVLSLDIYIAESATGKVIKKIESTSFGAHVDSYSFIETSGSWSPDNRKLAIVIQSKSKNKLLLIDIFTGEKKEYSPKDIDSFTHPAWSPDGSKIAFTGLKQGQSDLYLFDIQSHETIALTQDVFSDIQSAWSPDGSELYFVSDRGGRKNILAKEDFIIAKINIQTKAIEILSLFQNADNMNPQLSPNGKELYFLSDPDGFRNLYCYDISNKEIRKLTNFYTGISGITMYSPAISVASNSGEILYNYFSKGEYSIVKAGKTELLDESLSESLLSEAGSILAPGNQINGADIVSTNLKADYLKTRIGHGEFKNLKYSPKFKLEYLANSGLGMSTSRFGTGVGGGITALFSDMLNNNQLMGTAALNGEIQDFGGQLFYLNQKRPLQFGISASHLPYRLLGGYSANKQDSVGMMNGLQYYYGEVNQRIVRLFIDEVSGFVYKPFSKNTRIELGVSANWYSFGVKEYPQYGLIGFKDTIVVDFQPEYSGKPKKLDASELKYKGFNLGQAYVALVGDNTTFGTTAPLNGYRYRLELAKFIGSTSYNSILLDGRKYKYLKPFTFAGRFMYNGRLNPSNLELLNKINPLYLGYPWNMHGFWGNALSKQTGFITQENLQGEQMALANFEIRLPFTGPEKLALFKFDYLPSDLNFFVDAGQIWSASNKPGQTNEFPTFASKALKFKNSPIVTTGLSIRVNVLGYLVLEPYFAIPYYNGKKQNVVSGMNFMVPGW